MLKLNIKKILLLQAKECLTLNELAEKAGLTRNGISSIIHEKRQATPRTIGLLAKAFNVKVEELLIDED